MYASSNITDKQLLFKINYSPVGKSKGGKGSSAASHALHIDYAEVKPVTDIEKYWNELEKIVGDQRHYFSQHVTVR